MKNKDELLLNIDFEMKKVDLLDKQLNILYKISTILIFGCLIFTFNFINTSTSAIQIQDESYLITQNSSKKYNKGKVEKEEEKSIIYKFSIIVIFILLAPMFFTYKEFLKSRNIIIKIQDEIMNLPKN